MIEFPKDFFWGAATSAYQVEGNNRNCDWWEWEREVGLKETSGQACRHYELYPEDFDLARQLNHNAHRLSIEWSRIEPEPGKFSQRQIGHYRNVILALRERNLEPIVTLHHFTNPIWFARLGGWTNNKAADYFLGYVKEIVEALSDQVRYWVTINEPMVYVYHAFMIGAWPPQEKSMRRATQVMKELVLAHVKAYRLIHHTYKEKNLSLPMVSIAKNVQAFVPCTPTLRNKIATYFRHRDFNLEFIEKLVPFRALDFIGINYYTRGLVETSSWKIKDMLLNACPAGHSNLKKNCLGWDIYPEGLYKLLLSFRWYRLPVFILENGICTNDDNERWDFISEHLKSIHRAMAKGVKVLGYTYWSLLDNFEWDKGFSPRFGLIEVDYNTYKRTVRESAKKFALVCKTGRFE